MTFSLERLPQASDERVMQGFVELNWKQWRRWGDDPHSF